MEDIEEVGAIEFRDDLQSESVGHFASAPRLPNSETAASVLTGASDGVASHHRETSVVTTVRDRSGACRRAGWKARAAEIEESVAEGTQISSEDVKNIFRKSVTTAEVTPEEIARVKRVHDKISNGATFSFDYCTQLLIAIVIAGLGLMSDSSTTVISSMLISPIMGPVIGMAYGASVSDYKLVWRSLRIECISLLLCVFLGAVIAMCTGWTNLAEEWATDQMYSRGTTQNLLVGLPIAFFSGLAVALAVLDDQTSSLVGVAISASLLPPAVNTGLMLIYGCMLQTERLHEREEEEDENYFRMGLISFLLTVSNIILVIVSSMLMFRIKEVLPIKKKIFWHDLKTARRIYQKRALVSQTGGTSASKEALDLQMVDEEVGKAIQPGHTRSEASDQC